MTGGLPPAFVTPPRFIWVPLRDSGMARLSPSRYQAASWCAVARPPKIVRKHSGQPHRTNRGRATCSKPTKPGDHLAYAKSPRSLCRRRSPLGHGVPVFCNEGPDWSRINNDRNRRRHCCDHGRRHLLLHLRRRPSRPAIHRRRRHHHHRHGVPEVSLR